MGTLITQTPPSSPYDYSPHVLANSPRRIYRDILMLLARLFHPPFPPLKITWGLTFQLNPLSVTELNLSWEETWLCFPVYFVQLREWFWCKFVLKGLKAYWFVKSVGGGVRKETVGEILEGSCGGNHLPSVYQQLFWMVTISVCLRLIVFFFLFMMSAVNSPNDAAFEGQNFIWKVRRGSTAPYWQKKE